MSNTISKPSLNVTCPCCYYVVIAERDIYDICSVCYWEDEGIKWDSEIDLESVANHGLTLREARKNFIEFGARDQKWIGKVVSKENRTKFEFNPPKNAL